MTCPDFQQCYRNTSGINTPSAEKKSSGILFRILSHLFLTGAIALQVNPEKSGT